MAKSPVDKDRIRAVVVPNGPMESSQRPYTSPETSMNLNYFGRSADGASHFTNPNASASASVTELHVQPSFSARPTVSYVPPATSLSSNQASPIASTSKASTKAESPAKSTADDERSHQEKRQLSGGPDKANKKRRNRAVLSCIPCKARKIKCDREQPCSSCVRRRLTDQCRWDDAPTITLNNGTSSQEPPAEIESLRARLEYVESLLAKAGQLPEEEARASVRVSSNDSDAESEASYPTHGEEAAVGALESLALGTATLYNKISWLADQKHQHFPLGSTSIHPASASGSRAPFSIHTPEVTTSGDRDIYVQNIAPDTRTQSTIFLPVALPPASLQATRFLRDHAPEAMMASLIQALPLRETANILVDAYFLTFNWGTLEVFSERSFRREYSNFWEHLRQRKPVDVIDPAWLSNLFMMLAVSARQMAPSSLKHEDPSIIPSLADQFYLAARKSMETAEGHIRPQFRILQSYSLIITYVWFSASRNEGLVALANAMRIAQILGLGTLGNDQQVMPGWEDLAFPTGPSALKRQLCCRAWAHLCFMDHTFSSLRSMTVFYPIKGANTALPLSVNDDDLYGSNLVLEEKPITEFTDMTLPLLRNELVYVWRFIDSDEKRTYDDVLAMDKKIRQMMSRLPHIDSHGRIAGSEISGHRHAIAKSFTEAAISAHLVRTHQPYFYRSFSSTRYAYSREVCIRASSDVLDCNLQIIRATGGERLWYLHIQVFNATVCILLDLMHSIDSDLPGAHLVTSDRMRQARIASEIFRHDAMSARVPACARMGRMGAAIVEATLGAADDRRKQLMNGKSAEKESFTDTFQRIAASIATSPEASVNSSPAPSGMKNGSININGSGNGNRNAFTQAASGIVPIANLSVPNFNHHHQFIPNSSSSSSPSLTTTIGGSTMPSQVTAMQSYDGPNAFKMPSIDTSAQDILRNLGISLDNMVETPSNWNADADQSAHFLPPQSNSLPWAPASVFDDLFGTEDYLDPAKWSLASTF